MDNKIAEALSKLQKDIKDTGSTAVQIVYAFFKMKHLTAHRAVHPKDKHTKRGLENIVSKYKKLLKYLKRTDSVTYANLVSILGIRG